MREKAPQTTGPAPIEGAGPVAVVTGAGSGIGRAVARAMLDAGFRVALAGRRPEALDESGQGHPLALSVPTDVTVPEQVQRLFDAAVERWGRVDVLFNNAGVLPPVAAVDEVDLADWNQALAVNLTAAMLCSAAAVRVMKAQEPCGGRIINNGSVSAHAPRPRSVAYTVTKHAMTGLTRSIDLDGRGYGVSCGQIDIGNAATGLLTGVGVGSGALQPDGSRRVEPTFDVAEVARAVLLMAQLPPSANIGSMVLTAAGMPFIGRG